ncbi:MAG: HEAT repeat domain-containing protein, partial [Acidimicrobiia bacterium]
MATDREILGQIASGDPIPHLQDARPEIRRLAASACSGVRTKPVQAALKDLAANDEDEEVRAQAVEILGEFGPSVLGVIESATSDPSVRVVEAATTALGELGSPEAVPWLLETAAGHDESIVREAAVAALGALGDQRAL